MLNKTCRTAFSQSLNNLIKTMSKQSNLTKFLVLGLLSSLVNTAALAAGDAVRGETLSQTCLGCHGAPGLRNPGPVYSIPMVGGQHAEYIVAALKAYKSKERSHGTMQAQAASLSDQDMADIAEYFATVEGVSRPGNVNSSKAARGKEKSVTCASCHGPDGNGDNVIYPKLAGQYESFLVQALKDYRSGGRKNAIMSGFAAGLSITDIEELSAWYASLEDGVEAPKTKIFK